jgi:hypothetical protein
VAAILDSLRDHSPDERRDVLAEVIGDRGHTPANRIAALALWPGGDEGMSQEELLDLAGTLEDGPVLAAAIRQVTKRSMPRAATLLVAKLGSPDPGVRAAAVEVGAALAVAGVGGRARAMLDDPDRGVRRTSLDSLRRLRDPRVVPVAVAALTDRETQLPALACIAELGGPSQADAVADPAKRSPTAEVLPLAVRILTDWGREPGRPTAERLGLDRAVANVQGEAGLMVRWQVTAPISPEEADSLVARIGSPGRHFEPAAGGAARWQTLFATGSEARLRVRDDPGPNAEPVRLGCTDFTLPGPATLQFLAASNGTLRVWADGKLVHRRPEARPFQPDSTCGSAASATRPSESGSSRWPLRAWGTWSAAGTSSRARRSRCV